MSDFLNRRPIVGLATNYFYPLSESMLVFGYILLPFPILTIVMWTVLLIVMIKDRHYEDPNNLLIFSFGIADLLMGVTAFCSILSKIVFKGYIMGYTGNLYF